MIDLLRVQPVFWQSECSFRYARAVVFAIPKLCGVEAVRGWKQADFHTANPTEQAARHNQ